MVPEMLPADMTNTEELNAAAQTAAVVTGGCLGHFDADASF